MNRSGSQMVMSWRLVVWQSLCSDDLFLFFFSVSIVVNEWVANELKQLNIMYSKNGAEGKNFLMREGGTHKWRDTFLSGGITNVDYILVLRIKFLKKTNKRNTCKLFFLLFYADCQFILNRKTRFTKTFCFMLLNVFSYV